MLNEINFRPFAVLAFLILFLGSRSNALGCNDYTSNIDAITTYCNTTCEIGDPPCFIQYYTSDDFQFIECLGTTVNGASQPVLAVFDYAVAADPGCFTLDNTERSEGNTGLDASLVSGSSGSPPPSTSNCLGGGDTGAGGGLSDVSASSSVNIDTLALREFIPTVGLPFTLNYSSDRFQPGSSFNPATVGLGGWTPSILHHYNPTLQTLFFGDGNLYSVQAVVTGSGGYYTTNQDGSQVYYFDTNGVHQSTKDSITGVTLFSFSYDPDGRIISVSDQFANTVNFSYSNSQATITSPYGQLTTLSFDANGFLSSVANPSGETYSLSNDPNGLLLNVRQPMGQMSTVTYDVNGHVTEDRGAGGDLISILQQGSSSQRTVTVSTAQNRQTIYALNAAASPMTHTFNYPDGESAALSTAPEGPDNFSDSVGFTNDAILAPDPRFGLMAPYNQTAAYSVQHSPINITVQTAKTAHLSNASDPLSLIALLTTNTLQNDPTRIFTVSYNAQNETATYTSPLNRVVTESLNTYGRVSSLQAAKLAPVSFNYDTRGRLSTYQIGGRQATMTYDSVGNMASAMDFLGNLTGFTYDNSNRVVQETLPDGSVIRVGYDKNGNITSITPPGRRDHGFTHNLMGFLASYLPPTLSAELSGATNYQYSVDRQLTEIDRADGTTVGFNYDQTTGLLSSISTPQGKFSYSYVPRSSLVSQIVSPDNEVLKYSYIGNVATKVESDGPISGALQYAYNSDGTVTQFTPISAAQMAGTAINPENGVIGSRRSAITILPQAVESIERFAPNPTI